MKLEKEEADLFYRLYWSLLFYVNQKYPVIEGLNEPNLKYKSHTDVNELHEKVCNDPGLIDSFVSENPFGFGDCELGIIKSWKGYVKGRFLIVAHLKDYSVFMPTGGDQKVYGVLGLYDEIEDVVPPLMPLFVKNHSSPIQGQDHLLWVHDIVQYSHRQ